MSPLSLVILSLALGTDAAMVSFSAALRLPRLSLRQGFRLCFHFGLFQGGMTVIGWSGGAAIRGWLARVDHWIAFALLALVGIKMIFESMMVEKEDFRDPSRGILLITLAVATSIDALAVGIGLALLEMNIALAAIVIGIITTIMCAAALVSGIRGRQLFNLEKHASLVAGMVLVAIGIKILYDHEVFSSLAP